MDVFLILFLILLNAGFAMSEMGLTAARRARLAVLIEQGDSGAKAAAELMNHPTRFLSTVQVGITSIGVLNGIVGEAAFSESLSLWLLGLGMKMPLAGYVATGFVVTVITFLTIIFGELVPKRIGQTYPEAVARVVARPMQWLSQLAAPFVWLLSTATKSVLRVLGVKTQTAQVSHEEITANLDEGLDAGVIDSQEHALVQNVFDLEDRTLASIMRPRDAVHVLCSNAALQAACIDASSAGHSWYPVLKEDAQDWAHVLGLVSSAALTQRYFENSDAAWSDLVLAVRFVPETLSARELFAQFKERTERMVLVVDEYGDVQGLITPQDLLEAITGELYTPAQSPAWGTQNADGSWLLDGQMPVQEFKTQLAIDDQLQGETEERYNTLGGLVMHVLGDVPKIASQVTVGQWVLVVSEMDGRRVAKLKAQPLKG